MKEPLYRARIPVRREVLDDLMEVLAVMDPAPTSWEDMESGEAWVETCDLDRAVVMRRAREMADLIEGYDGRVHVADIVRLEPEEWTDAWKRFFHTTRLSDRIVIHPVWEPVSPEPGDIVIDIDPGMSFGTGLHPTTRTCLRFLDRLLAGPLAPRGQWPVASDQWPVTSDQWTVASSPGSASPCLLLDLGCGSGILSIGAAKMLLASTSPGLPDFRTPSAVIAALDFDPDAVAVARENLALNHIPEGVVEASVADVTRDPLPTARLVVANILASVLIQAADRIAATVAPGGALVLSGILDTQFAEVEAAYAAHGFRCEESVLDAEWRSGLFRKPCAPEAAVLR